MNNRLLRLASRLPLLRRLARGEDRPQGATKAHSDMGCSKPITDVFLVKRADGAVACFIYHSRGKHKPVACQITIPG